MRPKVAKRKAGLLGNLFSGFAGRDADDEAEELMEISEEETLDLVTYRRRARALLRSPASKTPVVFADELQALIHNLESVGASDSELDPLRDALAALRADSTTLDDARKALEAFADGGTTIGGARRAFWK